MGLKRSAIEILVPYIENSRILCLGYPDILIPKRLLEGFPPDIPASPHGRYHGLDEPIPETTAYFKALGAASIDYVDVKAWRGVERVCDLNEPDDLRRYGHYDLVIDPGTIEHCFNIGVAMRNAAEAVKVGGAIFHCPPVSMVNHGFWNVSPTAMQDFYTQNGWEVRKLLYERGDVTEPADPVARQQVVHEASLYCLAVRAGGDAMHWVVQRKYLNLMGAK